jgi:hypothetical protein
LKSFTLVELLLAVSILAIGIVGVLRSFLGAVTVLDHVNNRLVAIRYLDERASLSVIDSYFRTEEPFDQAEENIDIKGRSAVFHASRIRLEDSAHEGLDELTLSVVWKERNALKDETMVFFEQSKI